MIHPGLMWRVARLIPLAALVAAGGCFATRNDVRVVQTDLANTRAEMLKAAAEQRDALTQAMRVLQVSSDSIRVMSNRLTTIQGDVRGGLRDVNEQLIQVQVLLKQSETTIRDLRREQEQRFNQPPVMALPPVSGPPLTAADSAAMIAAAQPQAGPLTLLSTARSNLARQSYSTARLTFQEVLDKYPTAEFAAAAQLGIGQSYEGERQIPAALDAYSAVITRYPDAPETATALFKKATILLGQGKPAEAKPLLQQIVTRFKTSDVYELAVDRLRNIR